MACLGPVFPVSIFTLQPVSLAGNAKERSSMWETECLQMDVSKNRGKKKPKMDGENNGNPY